MLLLTILVKFGNELKIKTFRPVFRLLTLYRLQCFVITGPFCPRRRPDDKDFYKVILDYLLSSSTSCLTVNLFKRIISWPFYLLDRLYSRRRTTAVKADMSNLLVYYCPCSNTTSMVSVLLST